MGSRIVFDDLWARGIDRGEVLALLDVVEAANLLRREDLESLVIYGSLDSNDADDIREAACRLDAALERFEFGDA